MHARSPFDGPLPRLPRHKERHGDILGRRERGKEVVLLEDEADVAGPEVDAPVAAELGLGRAEQGDVARGGVEEAGQATPTAGGGASASCATAADRGLPGR